MICRLVSVMLTSFLATRCALTKPGKLITEISHPDSFIT